MYAASADARERLVAVSLVHRTGTAAAAAWVEAMESRPLRGYALIALSTMPAERPESKLPMVRNPDPNDLDGVATDLLAQIGSDNADPERVVACFAKVIPAGSEERVFELMALGPTQKMRQALEVLSRSHPDRGIARGARIAARAQAGSRPSTGQARPQGVTGQARTQPRYVQDARPSLPRR